MTVIMNDQIRSAARDAMRARKVTQQQLAEQVGISQPSVAQLLSGRRQGQPEVWEKLLAALGLRLEMQAVAVGQ